MSQPNVQAMNRKELLAYFFDHRDAQAAFYALMDKLATPVSATMPPSNGRDETEELRKILDDIRKKRQQEEQT